ncbi:hypothetical protein EDB85DRAFT_1893522 [Lactarius pseudohatsudake]|nr:hypothetical protein EDB85DRAFT_1893522 [Lactarius pseudohatsudake]
MQSTTAGSIKKGPSPAGKVMLSRNSPQPLLMIAHLPDHGRSGVNLGDLLDDVPLTQWFIRTGAGVSVNAKGSPNKDGIARSGANDKAGVLNNGTDSAAAALKKEMDRFVERGEGSKPVVGKQYSGPFPDPPREKTAPQSVGSGKSRPLPRTSTDKSRVVPEVVRECVRGVM